MWSDADIEAYEAQQAERVEEDDYVEPIWTEPDTQAFVDIWNESVKKYRVESSIGVYLGTVEALNIVDATHEAARTIGRFGRVKEV